MRIAYVGPFSLSTSSANMLRVKGVAQALSYSGHKVIVCPGGGGVNESSFNGFFSDQIELDVIDEYKSSFWSFLSRGARGLFLGDVTVQWLEKLRIKPDVIILYGTHLGYLCRLLAFCKKYNIRLLLDVVEWYDPSHLPGGRFGPFAISNEFSMRKAVKLADGAFVISAYLRDYYALFGFKTLRLPPLLSSFSLSQEPFRKTNGLLNLCYIGLPGKKEEFLTLFSGVGLAIKSGCRIKVHVAGVSESEFLANYPKEYSVVSEFHDAFKFYGRLDNEEAKLIAASSDFLLIARKPERFANAGFPFKVAESLMLGTPVISNCFSDISEYLVDGVNSILVDSLTPNAIANAILSAASLDESALTSMRHNAAKAGNNFFSTTIRAKEVDLFVRGVL